MGYCENKANCEMEIILNVLNFFERHIYNIWEGLKSLIVVFFIIGVTIGVIFGIYKVIKYLFRLDDEKWLNRIVAKIGCKYIDDYGEIELNRQSPIEIGNIICGDKSKYKVLQAIGCGGIGIVYKGVIADKTEKKIAIKILSPDYRFPLNEKIKERFNREIELFKSSKHRNIVRFIDNGNINDTPFYVTELCSSKDLKTRIKNKELIELEKIKIMLNICDGLQFLHNKKIVHRDITPKNILFGTNFFWKITDLGIALLIEDIDKNRLTETFDIMGNRDYIAPEQRRNPRVADSRADIYSAGIIFYELITAELPPILPLKPSEINPHWDEKIDKIVVKMICSEKEDRYKNIDLVYNELKKIISDLRKKKYKELLISSSEVKGSGEIAVDTY